MSAIGTPARDVFTPSALNRLVRDLLHDALPPLWVEGEIGSLARPASGHLYFALKDDSAQIRCALFRQHGRELKFRPDNGIKVLVRGRIGLYEARGDYQLIVEHMEEAGEGALQREFERLKARLEAEGLFAAERKRSLPAWPRRIGILSSPSGAAVRDVISVIRRRLPLVEVELMPVPVQGKEAPAAIRTMLQRAQQAGRHDVLLLTRGGGSLEDLWAFNDEALARLIAASPMPVVSAVGHEVDFTLADFAADVRAATPSVAGELLVPDQQAIARRLQQHHSHLDVHMRRKLQGHFQALDHAQIRLRNQRPALRLARCRERLEALRQRLHRAQPMARLQARLDRVRGHLRIAGLAHRLQQARHGNAQLRVRLRRGQRLALARWRAELEALQRALHAVSPLATLERGYALVFDDAGHTIHSVEAVAPHATMTVRFSDGSVRVRRISDSKD